MKKQEDSPEIRGLDVSLAEQRRRVETELAERDRADQAIFQDLQARIQGLANEYRRMIDQDGYRETAEEPLTVKRNGQKLRD